jgi:hypothetical protein
MSSQFVQGAEFPLRLLRTTRPRRLSADDISALRAVERTDWRSAALRLGDTRDEELAARLVSLGAVASHGFGNIFAMTTHPGQDVVAYANQVNGRAKGYVNSITTTLRYIPELFDWSLVPPPLNAMLVMDLIDALFEMGPFGFVGPAAGHIPAHLSTLDGDIRTTQIIGAGYRCRSNVFLERCIQGIDDNFLCVTLDEPPHYRLAGVQAAVGGRPGCFVLADTEQERVRSQYPAYLPMAPTVIGFQRVLHGSDGRPVLRIERHGSLHVDDLRPILDSHGFGLELGPDARQRVRVRDYSKDMVAA